MKSLLLFLMESIGIRHDERNMNLTTNGGILTYIDFPLTTGLPIDAFEIQEVHVDRNQRGKGIGKTLVKEFLKYAEKKKKDVVLYASVLDTSTDKMSDKQLIDWYKSLGFNQIPGEDEHILKYSCE